MRRERTNVVAVAREEKAEPTVKRTVEIRTMVAVVGGCLVCKGRWVEDCLVIKMMGRVC